MKSLIESKIVWLAILNLVMLFVSGFTTLPYKPVQPGDIVGSLDWSKVLQGLISLLLIVARWYTTDRISGFLPSARDELQDRGNYP